MLHHATHRAVEVVAVMFGMLVVQRLAGVADGKKARFTSEHGLSAYDADVLVAEKALADYFEATAKGRDRKAAANGS